MAVVIGKRFAGTSIYIPRAILTESTPGQVYELHIRTTGIADAKKPVEVLTAEMPRKFRDLKILWMRVDDRNIYMQIQGSPFPWSLLLLWLPEILSAIGIIVTAIAVFLVAAQVPTWLWVMLATGVGLIYLGPRIGSYIRGLFIKRAKELWVKA